MTKKRTFMYYYCCDNDVCFKVFFAETIKICNDHFKR